MLNILITGANGQLGNEIKECAAKIGKNKYFYTDIDTLDITQKQDILRFVKQNNINVTVNCAAYTQVDKAEDDKQQADLINHIAVKNLAESAKENNITLIHISTDYVFDGNKNIPYTETDTTHPIGVYGQTKLQGELAIQKTGGNYLIIRTSWLYSSFGNNFVKTMLKLTAEKDNLKVVFDQIGTPTYAKDLAQIIIYIIENNLFANKQELYHYSNEGVCSWYDFAMAIKELSQNNCTIQPCHSDEFPSKVKRPHFSVLDKTKIKKDFGIEIRYWREALKDCIT